MAFLQNDDGVLFFFNKCGTTMLRQTMPKGYAWHEHDSLYPISGRTSARVFMKHTKMKPMYILVRDPIERFISGYWHYWRHYKEDFLETKKFVNLRYKKLITEYTFDVHMDLVKQFDGVKLQHRSDHACSFFQHCVHDIGDEYVDGMEIVRLGTTSTNPFLEPLLTTTKFNATDGPDNTFDYPDLKIADIHLEYIHNKFKKTKERFGY